jgi:uncharacterized protein
MSEVNYRIDPHIHILPQKRLAGLMRWIKKGFPQHPVPVDIDAEGILSDLRKAGTTHFFNLCYPIKVEETDFLNDWNMDFCKKTPGAIPFASLHQETTNKVEVAEKSIENGFVGFKFHPFVQKFDPWDKRMDNFYEFMNEAKRPVIFHTGFDDF